MKKDKLIQLRISEKEKNIIKEKARLLDMSISNYICYCAVSKRIAVSKGEKGRKKINFDNMKECIVDVDYFYTEENGDLFFADNQKSCKLKEDIRDIIIYFDEQKGYYLEDGRSLNEVIEK